MSESALTTARALSGRAGARLGSWSPFRAGMALLAVLASVVTAGLWVLLAGPTVSIPPVGFYVVATGFGLFFPAAIAVQVVLGQLLIGTLLIGPMAANPLSLVPLIGGVLASAELLAVVARSDTPIRRSRRDVLPRLGRAVVIGCAAFAIVASVGLVSAPTGVWAVAVAAGACVVLGTRLARGST